VHTTWTREGFDRAAAALSVDGDRCLRHVQCRDGRSRVKARCCASRVNVRVCSRFIAPLRSLFSYRACVRDLVSRTALSNHAVSGTRFRCSRRRRKCACHPKGEFFRFAQTPCSEARALSSRAAQGPQPCRYPALLSFSLRRTSLRDKSRTEFANTLIVSFECIR